ncbi:hypothetical protein DAMA08_034120 [Martiniozyma asiatica (nom. inval.)]|nr:hypothetical protein DAMA08_034120 [Martiniozyma asiatica]
MISKPISTDGCAEYSITIPNQGTLTGVTLKDPLSNTETVHKFAAVPYAQPCIGFNRFGLPKELPADYDYTGEYKEFGLRCPQPFFESSVLNYPREPSDEAIQYNNIWIPSDEKLKPKDGWPVLIYIHGGWLQYGSPNNSMFDIVELMGDKELLKKFILVTPGYRLNIFGFLSCKELLEEDPNCSNMGFWDQRLAIEWTYKNIKHFGGNPEKMTVSGLSAGSYSLFFQLAYEIYNPKVTQIIKQCIFFSNMILAQPKLIEECQVQFEEVVKKFGIQKDLSSADKLKALRNLKHEEITELILDLKLHTFRAVSDDKFVSKSILQDITSGKFGALLAKKGVRIMQGETNNEGYLYSFLDTPKSLDQLAVEIENYYPKSIVPTILELYDTKSVDESAENSLEILQKLFGDIIGDGQIYVSTRGFAKNIIKGGFPVNDYFRYRISFRAKWMDDYLSKEAKVPHAGDTSIWFYTIRNGYTATETAYLKKWLSPFTEFVHFENEISDWERTDLKKLRYFAEDGSIVYTDDPVWDWGIKVSSAVYDAQLKKNYSTCSLA